MFPLAARIVAAIQNKRGAPSEKYTAYRHRDVAGVQLLAARVDAGRSTGWRRADACRADGVAVGRAERALHDVVGEQPRQHDAAAAPPRLDRRPPRRTDRQQPHRFPRRHHPRPPARQGARAAAARRASSSCRPRKWSGSRSIWRMPPGSSRSRSPRISTGSGSPRSACACPNCPASQPTRGFARNYPAGAAVAHLTGYVGAPKRRTI